MTNREKYAEQILDIACSGYSIAILKRDNTLFACDGERCEECICNCNCGRSCNQVIAEWANSEYVEKPKISESDRRFLDYIPDEYNWMARDKNGLLYVYYCKPFKSKESWISENIKGVKEFKISFSIVKWEDEEPWLIEDLKKLEVVDKYGKDDN